MTPPFPVPPFPVVARIRFKMMVLAYKAVNGTVPADLQALVRPHAPQLGLNNSLLNYLSWTSGTAIAKSTQRSVMKVTTILHRSCGTSSLPMSGPFTHWLNVGHIQRVVLILIKEKYQVSKTRETTHKRGPSGPYSLSWPTTRQGSVLNKNGRLAPSVGKTWLDHIHRIFSVYRYLQWIFTWLNYIYLLFPQSIIHCSIHLFV